jgi:hypothetical protein
MSKIMRVVVLTTALLAVLASASTAGAVTWHSTGDTAFTATSGPTTLHFDTVHMSCTGATTTATTSASPFVGATYAAATGTLTWPHCTLAGVAHVLECSYTETLSSQTGGLSHGVLDASCGLYAFGTKLCGYDGTIPVTYTNPTSGVAGSVTLGQASLPGSNPPSGNCPYKPFQPTDQTLTVTSGTGGPVITRTT